MGNSNSNGANEKRKNSFLFKSLSAGLNKSNYEVNKTEKQLNPIHQGPVLGIYSCYDTNNSEKASTTNISNIFTCSDDNKAANCNIHFTNPNNNKFNVANYYEGHTKAVNKVICVNEPDSSSKYSIWTASRDLSLKQWDKSSGECLQTISNAHTLNISAIAYDTNRSFLFSASRDYSIKCWDVSHQSGSASSNTVTKPNDSLMEFSAPRNIVTAMYMDSSVSPNLLYQASEDLSIRVWDTRMNNGNYKNISQTPAMHITGFVYFPLCLDIHNQKGHLLVAGCKGIDGVGGELKLFDLRYLQDAAATHKSAAAALVPIAIFTGHQHDVTGCKFATSSPPAAAVGAGESDDLPYILSTSKDGTCRAWNYNDTHCSDGNSSSTSSSAAESQSHHLVINSYDKSFTCMSSILGYSSHVGNNNNNLVSYIGAMDGSVSQLVLTKKSSNISNTVTGDKKKAGKDINSSSSSSSCISVMSVSNEHGYILDLQEISSPYLIKPTHNE